MDNHEKENALNIVTDERTYQVFAESPEDARYCMMETAEEKRNQHRLTRWRHHVLFLSLCAAGGLMSSVKCECVLLSS